ncbi:MAG: 3'-5' exonuclease, partial [Pseudomonadota bacterium]
MHRHYRAPRAPLAVAELDTLFEEHGRTDYAHIAQAALAALGNDDAPTDLALLLDYRIRHILVDEMQDTSLAQYELLERLTAGWEAGDGRTLFCVGDPMQSIYRFRQAEVSRFLLATREGIGGVALEPLTLSINFRSAARLIDWCNAAFQRLFPAESDVALGAVTHSPSVSGSDVPAGDGGVEVHPLIDADREAEAAAVAGIVGAELAAGSTDIAILATSRATLTPVAAALRAAAIPYDTLDVDRLADAAAIQPLLAIARALSHPADRIAWLGLLRAPWAALDLGSLVALCGDDHTATIAEIVADPARLARLHPSDRAKVRHVGDEMQRARDDALATFAERVESVWYRLGGPLALEQAADATNSYRCLDLLRRLSAGGQAVDAAALYAALEQETISAVHPGDVRVRLMTVHRAKGLEFDCVIVPGLGRRGRADTARLLRWATVPGPRGSEAALISLASSRRSLDDDRLHNYLGEIERRKAQYELDRLLYVAATRAKRRLHLLGHATTGADGALQTPPARTLLNRLWPEVRGYYEAAAATRPAVAATPPAAAVQVTGTVALGDVAPAAPPPPAGAGPREASPIPELEFRRVSAPTQRNSSSGIGDASRG